MKLCKKNHTQTSKTIMMMKIKTASFVRWTGRKFKVAELNVFFMEEYRFELNHRRKKMIQAIEWRKLDVMSLGLTRIFPNFHRICKSFDWKYASEPLSWCSMHLTNSGSCHNGHYHYRNKRCDDCIVVYNCNANGIIAVSNDLNALPLASKPQKWMKAMVKVS